jgi:hypothetical protein
MVYRRRSTFRRRRPIRRRRVVSRAIRRRMRPVVSRPLSTNIHKYVRWMRSSVDPAVEPTTISCNFGSSGESPAALTFRLDTVANASEFTNLYDLYKILKVQVFFDYTPDVVPGLTPNASFMPKLWIKRDYDDTGTPTLLEMAQSNQAKCLRFSDTRTTRMVVLAPRYANEIYRTSVSTAYTSQRGAWIDCNNADVPHFGLKCIAQGLPSQNLGAFTVRVKYHLLFKNVR